LSWDGAFPISRRRGETARWRVSLSLFRQDLQADGTSRSFLQLFEVLMGAKVGSQIVKRLGQPVVIGQSPGGLVAGPAALSFYEVNCETQIFAEIGVDRRVIIRDSSAASLPYLRAAGGRRSRASHRQGGRHGPSSDGAARIAGIP
jgi:hypothetical protein